MKGALLMSELSVELGRRMRARRKELDITQEQVANACLITKSTVSRYEKVVIEHPHRPTVEAIANVLHVQPDWLYAQTEDAAQPPAQDLRRIIADAKARLMTQEGLMFDGEPVSAEALQSILDALDIGMSVASRRQNTAKK
jgi:transcriptional regulator with XRE-family HTH domain